MNGEISIPKTGMNDMWTIRDVWIEIGGVDFVAPTGGDYAFTPPVVDGYKPVCICGYIIANEKNGVLGKKTVNGKTYNFQGASWVCPVSVRYYPESGIGKFYVRSYSNTASSSTVNKEGGTYVMTYARIFMLYFKDSGAYVPAVTDAAETTTIDINYGLTAAITSYGRMRMIVVNGKVNANVAKWGALASGLPVPLNSKGVFATNAANPAGPYIYLTTTGILQPSGALSKDSYVHITMTYISA